MGFLVRFSCLPRNCRILDTDLKSVRKNSNRDPH